MPSDMKKEVYLLRKAHSSMGLKELLKSWNQKYNEFLTC